MSASVEIWPDDTASTGPRSFERGGHVFLETWEVADYASTGPRSFERGGPPR